MEVSIGYYIFFARYRNNDGDAASNDCPIVVSATN